MSKMVILPMLALVAFAGCQTASVTPAPAAAPLTTTQPATKPAAETNYLAKNAIAKDPSAPGETAVENALNWANKYSQAMQTVSQLQQENRSERDKFHALQLENTKLQDEMAVAQKELKEANAMLMEMRQELTKWKLDVLGFRQEIRTVEQAQAAALTKIIKLLGGEAPAPAAATQPTSAPAPEATSAPAR